jgi:hypothetical protein
MADSRYFRFYWHPPASVAYPSGTQRVHFTITGPAVSMAPQCYLKNLNGQDARNAPTKTGNPQSGLVEWFGIFPGQYEVLVLGGGVYRSQVFGPIEVV